MKRKFYDINSIDPNKIYNFIHSEKLIKGLSKSQITMLMFELSKLGFSECDHFSFSYDVINSMWFLLLVKGKKQLRVSFISKRPFDSISIERQLSNYIIIKEKQNEI